jgi:hypothetical protein
MYDEDGMGVNPYTETEEANNGKPPYYNPAGYIPGQHTNQMIALSHLYAPFGRDVSSEKFDSGTGEVYG